MRVLVDPGALLALSRAGDQYHGQAVRVATSHLAGGGRFVGTTLILGELYSHFAVPAWCGGGAKRLVAPAERPSA